MIRFNEEALRGATKVQEAANFRDYKELRKAVWLGGLDSPAQDTQIQRLNGQH